ncbi:tRNA-methyltransferase non-catalytic subunit trm6MTase subunit [Citrus sinensis]|uniref:tRNA-methyltransferase non-catalytic subunit trm6MTase subunit n=1 Tax=Citrus sinensis TaxID=2711 RepID=A0ACB8KWX5_CITSI|nr:tRNA-methyltransferase non-catalytic subunit trm6MTase subunit [Citrus sinensis]
MDPFKFNNVKAEKAKAMRNFNRQKILKKLEVFTALALMAWSSYNYIPVAVKISADFLRHNVAVFGQPLYVFIAVNMLIVIISVLSLQKPAKQDFYKEYVSITNRSSTATSAKDDQKPAPEVTVSDNQIACVDNVVNSPVEAKAAAPVPLEDCELPKRAVSAVGTVTEAKEYRRTRSERRSSEMDDLSSEEFRMTIETFIASKRKTLIEENTLDLKLENKQSLALTLSAVN